MSDQASFEALMPAYRLVHEAATSCLRGHSVAVAQAAVAVVNAIAKLRRDPTALSLIEAVALRTHRLRVQLLADAAVALAVAATLSMDDGYVCSLHGAIPKGAVGATDGVAFCKLGLDDDCQGVVTKRPGSKLA